MADPTDKPPRGPGATSALPARRRFGRYELVRELGRGAMGVVHQAWDRELKRTVALKLLLAEAGAPADDTDRFLREARAAARLRHPNIIQVHDVGTWDGRYYFTMDFIEGESLATAQAHLPPRRFLEVLRDVALALQAAHEAGVVHRDVKPANILLDRSGRPYLGDFGLAKDARAPAGNPATASGEVMGTPHYMSPEQAGGRTAEIGPRSDVWSLGVLLYQHLAGRMPFAGTGYVEILRAIAECDPPAPAHAAAAADAAAGAGAGARHPTPVSRDLETICLKCLEKDPRRRYGTAADLAADLGRVLDGEPITARPVGRVERLARRAVRHRRVVVPVAAAFLLAAAFGAYARHARSQKEAADSQAAAAAAELTAEGLLLQAETTWREAKAVLYRPQIPLERYHEKLAGTLALYVRALAACRTDGWIYESRARLKIQLDDLDGAEEDCQAALHLPGTDWAPAARRSLGRIYLQRSFDLRYGSSDWDCAVKALQAKEWRARALRELEASAGRIAWRGTAEEGDNAERLARGFAAWAAGDADGAARILRDGFERNPDEEVAWALSVCTTGDARDRWRQKALELCPRYARALLDRGGARQEKGDLAGALADYDAALGINPRDTVALNNRGAARQARGDLAGALADYDAAIRGNPRNAGAWVNRGAARRQRDDLAGARADYDEALRIDPKCTEALIGRGGARRTQGDPAGARADYDAALRIDPRNTVALANRGAARQAQGDFAGARADYDAALRINPRFAEAYVNRSVTRQAQGDLAGAIADCDEALRISPQDAEAFYNRGSARQEQNDAAGALADYGEAVRINPRFAEAYANRGSIRRSGGDLAGAAADFEKALEVGPPGWPHRETVAAWLRAARGK